MQLFQLQRLLLSLLLISLFGSFPAWAQTAINYSVRVLPKESEEYRARKAVLLEALDEIEKTVEAAEESDSTKAIQTVIDLGRGHLNADSLPLGITDEPDIAAFLQTSVSSEKTEHVLALGDSIPEDFVASNDNDMWFGTLLHELQHLNDWERYGVNDDHVRIFAIMESAGHLIQAWYYKLLDPNWVDSHPEAKAMVVAAVDAPDGPLWKAYLDEATLYDLALLQLLENYQFNTLPTLSSGFQAIPDVLLPQAKLAAVGLEKATAFMDSHKPAECSAGDEDFRKFVKDMRFVSTYVFGANNMFNNFVGPKLGKPDEKSLSIYQEWKQLHRTIRVGLEALAVRKEYEEFSNLKAEKF